MESQSEKNESKKTDLLLFPLRKDAWPKWVSDLKDHLWKHCEKSTHTVELDGAKKAKLTPAGMTAQSIFEHQMHAFTELKRHFSECNSAEIESVDITKDNFASELFKVLDEQWKPGDFSSASAKIDELRHAYKTFNGNPIMYFQKIKTLVIWLTKQHHQPNTAEVCKNCVDAVYAFANQKKATNADKMWGVWLATFEREFTHFTLDNLSKDLTKNYDTYLRMKRQEGKVADDEAGDLVTFNARDNERDERDEPERRRPRWNRRHSTGNSRDSRSAHWVDNRERGRSRERGSFRPREGGGSHHSSRGGRNGWKPKRGRSEGDRERLSERKYPHRDSRSPSRHDSRDRRSGNGAPSSTLKDKSGKIIDCRLCGGNHFMDNCPHIEDARERYGKRKHNSNHNSSRRTPKRARGRAYNSMSEHSEPSESSYQSESEQGSGSFDESEYDSSADRKRAGEDAHYTRPRCLNNCTFMKNNNNKTDTSWQTTMLVMFITCMLAPLIIARRTLSNTFAVSKLVGQCAIAPPLLILILLYKITRPMINNTARVALLLLQCYISLPLYVMSSITHTTKHTTMHIKQINHTSIQTSINILSMAAAIITVISPITYDDDTQSPTISTRIGEQVLYTYARNKRAYENPHFSLANWIPLIFNTKTTARKTKNNDGAVDDPLLSHSERDRLSSDENFDHLPPLEEGEEWMIADSGANRHYHRHNRFLFRREKIDSAIGGMTGDNQASTDEFGIFAARLEDEDGVNIPLTSVGYSVKNAKVGLFSEVQTCFAGNTVIHKGHPERGKHGIILKGSNIFIPYHFDRQTLLWWIKVKPPRTQHCMHAAEMNPNDFVNP